MKKCTKCRERREKLKKIAKKIAAKLPTNSRRK